MDAAPIVVLLLLLLLRVEELEDGCAALTLTFAPPAAVAAAAVVVVVVLSRLGEDSDAVPIACGAWGDVAGGESVEGVVKAGEEAARSRRRSAHRKGLSGLLHSRTMPYSSQITCMTRTVVSILPEIECT